MAERGLGFWGSVVAAVVSTAILGIAAVLFTWQDVVTWIRAAMSWLGAAFFGLWSAITYSVPVPAWLIAIGVAALVWALYRMVRTNSQPFEQLAAPGLEALSPNEYAVVKQLAQADGVPVDLDDLSGELGMSWLLTEQAVQRLYGRQVIEPHRGLSGTGVHLTRRGRDLVIDEGLTLGAAAVAARATYRG